MTPRIPTCPLCDDDQPQDELHVQTSEHKFNQLLDTFQRKVKSLRSARHGIELKIEVQQRNGFVLEISQTPDSKGNHFVNITPEAFQGQNNHLEFLCIVKNGRTSRGDDILITSGGKLHPFPYYSFRDPNGFVGQQKLVQLGVGETYQLIVSFQLKETVISSFKIPFYISFQTFSRTEDMKGFSIYRAIVVSIHNNVADEIVEVEKSPFTFNKWEEVTVTPPSRKNFAAMKPDEFPIPREYFKTMVYGLKRDFWDGIFDELQRKLHPGYVTRENYSDFFHVLLWLEETSCILGISCYNMEDVRLKCIRGKVLELKVPGLAEKRPSVLKGDSIQLKVQGDHEAYEGLVCNVTESTVEIEGVFQGFVETVAEDPDTNIDVRFLLRRIHFERMHQGVRQVVATGFVDNLFPDESLLMNPVQESILLARTDLHNQQIYDNVEQITAVHKIINETSKSVPYIVWGPPGTGKTVTIVEAIYQLKRMTSQKILVCAPANAACNMLTEKLATFCRPTELRRIMADNCDTASVHKDILNYCNLVQIEKQRDVTRVSIAELKQFRIVVTTLILAAKYTKEYHPDIIFVDEAAQAREPELCCAIGLLSKTKRLVLAGDPKQLGPVIHSEICKKYKYDSSLLERLMALPLYENDTNHNFTTMLKLNFRSHPEILRLPNQLFYENLLTAVSASAISDSLAQTYVYPLIHNRRATSKNKGSPIEFCSVIAKEKREGRSPSFYNLKEVQMVKAYVQVLTNTLNVEAVDIGIVTPYMRQMHKIRGALNEVGDIDVGTTETFQGREKRVMIISAVRAQEDFLLYDSKYKLGFVVDDKRFNVAVTRAKSKLIIIGNPLILYKDEKWGALIDQAQSLGTLCGAPFPIRSANQRRDISELLGLPKLDAGDI